MTLDESLVASPERGLDLVALDDALEDLARVDPRKSQVVELRFFGGLSVEETAEALKVSPETVTRDWRLAKVWLLRELSGRDRCTPDRWQQIERCINDAARRSRDRREAFLRKPAATTGLASAKCVAARLRGRGAVISRATGTRRSSDGPSRAGTSGA